MRIIGSGLLSVDNIFLVRNGTFGQDSENEGVLTKGNLPL